MVEGARVAADDVAWAAGVVDAIGNLTTRKIVSSGTTMPMVAVNCPNLALLNELGRLTRTKPTVVHRAYAKAGCAVHCSTKHQHVRSTSGMWSLTGSKATIFLAGIVPQLRLQRDAAEVLVELGRKVEWRVQAVKDMRDLGWDIPERILSEKLQ